MTSPSGVAKVQWYLSQNGKRFGPLSSQVLRQLAGTGRVGADAWLLQEGMDVWVRASSILGTLPAAKDGGPKAAPPLPRPSALATAVPSRTCSAPAPSIVLTGTTCPSCGVRCRIPKPQGMAVHRCPHCTKPFRAVATSVGVMARSIDEAGQVTVREAGSPRTAMP